MSYFYDSTVRHQLGFDDPKGYFTVVGPHEIAHQWWGHTVTWASYRDQWMSEGFADFSASLFLQVIEKNPQKFIKFWNDQRELLTERNKEGLRAIDVGPLTMGYRLNNTKTGNITRRLIYPKGSYILHMIRMMMWSARDGDAQFKEMMRDFVKTYYNKPASTEDFKAMVQKHMLPSMDVTHDHKMDWFFDPYVYGTALPNYKFTYNVTPGDKGPVLDFQIAQSNVTDDFKMIVPLYLELANGRVLRLGSTLVAGNSTKSERVDLGALGLKEAPKRVLINYYDDVLSTSN
jgi:aminopeptidase N